MFKKLMLAGVAASMVAAPTLASAAPQNYRVIKERPNRTVVVDRGPGYRERTVIRHNDARRFNQRNWQRGQRFDRRYATNYRQIDYRGYRNRGVYAPPRGYQWVQSGNDAVLVALASGLIGAVIGGALR
ncbi:RcnB family protein [Sphingomonas sp. Y38-1Y]|uniref:RcnB family protein n=1 Tax=Sphingomonas sp. Y38-1Y TaxID=3078265 RepID=UPI0028E767A7|nr:RcnB family protein [Sphingomonas sp. Y38-1Y]